VKVIFVAGPRRARTIFGLIYNIWKARRVAKRLWEDGWVVICPHLNTATLKDGERYFRGYCEIVKRSDALYLLKGWQSSEGSCVEYRVAIENKLEVIFEDES